VNKKKESVFIYNNMVTEETEIYSQKEHEKVAKELKADENRKFLRERKVVTQVVKKSIFSGDAFLEKPKVIAGKWIPITPIRLSMFHMEHSIRAHLPKIRAVSSPVPNDSPI